MRVFRTSLAATAALPLLALAHDSHGANGPHLHELEWLGLALAVVVLWLAVRAMRDRT
ncbi:MAG: hypothetical protein ACKVQR_16040 [Aquabacterium sp.]